MSCAALVSLLAPLLVFEPPPASAAGPAGIKLDGSLGPSAAALAGPTYNIAQNLGKLSGGNLFFSFQYFNVATGETALFTTTSAGINNVISRVIGGYSSTIDGTIALQAASGAPNFFLINPSGVTFTANSVVDVPAAFYVSTANYLKFSDGNFYADPSKMSALSAAAPEAFGFLGTTRTPVNIQGANLSAGVNGAGDFQISAGDVTVDGGGAQAGISNTTGAIRVSAVGSASAEVPLSGPFASNDGTVTIRNGGELASQGQGVSPGGAITVNAGSLLIDGMELPVQSGIFSMAGNTSDAGALTVTASNDATIVNGGVIISRSHGVGDAGQVTGQFGSLTIDGGTSTLATGIASNAEAGSTGAAGEVVVNVMGNASIANSGEIASFTFGAGNAGQITARFGSLSIDGGRSALLTGIATNANPGALGSAGDINVDVTGNVSIASSGVISSSTFSAGNAGQIIGRFGSLSIDGASSTFLTGIATDAYVGSSGSAGDINVDIAGSASIVNNGEISSSTFGGGNAGQITAHFGTLTIDGGASNSLSGIASQANSGSTGGSAGNVNVNVTGSASIVNGGVISSSSFGPGNAGQVAAQFGSLSINGGTSTFLTGIESQANGGATGGSAGNVSVNVTGSASIVNGGAIDTSTFGAGRGGDIVFSSQNLTINGENASAPTEISSDTLGAGNAGQVKLTVGNLAIDAGTSSSFAGISSNAYPAATGSAGDIIINVAAGASVVNGGEIVTETNGPGHAGNIAFSAQSLTMNGENASTLTEISSDTFATGNAGQVKLQVESLTIDGGTSSYFTGISSEADQGATGAAGDIAINVTGIASIVNGAQIATDTNGPGKAGQISIDAQTLIINAQNNNNGQTSISSDTYGAGNAGQVKLQVGALTINGGTSSYFAGISSDTNQGATGSAGDVIVNVAGGMSIVNGALIESDTYGVGDAGQVKVQAGSLAINGGASAYTTGISSEADQGATGSAGNITIKIAGGASIVSGAEIETDTFGPGNGGLVNLKAGSLLIAGPSGIYSNTEQGSSGSAGSILLGVAAGVVVQNGGGISTTSFGSGPAGDVNISANRLTIGGGSNASGIFSNAALGSGGQPGRIVVDSGDLSIEPNGAISIANDASVSNPSAITPTQIIITSGQIEMRDGLITAASSGNIAASAIDIRYGSGLRMDPSTISTASQDGNGGPITINGAGPLLMSHSNITTSVLGATNGNGGDIGITVPAIAMDTGAIQANTLAPLASGGTISINSQLLVPSYQSFVAGGSAINFVATAAGLNVVQAAAPDGVNGALNVTVPTLDLGNALLGLTVRAASSVTLGRSLCGATQGNSLTVVGRGGIAPTAYDPLWIELDHLQPEAVAQISPSTVEAIGDRVALTAAACR